MFLGVIYTPKGPIFIPNTGPWCWNTDRGCDAIQITIAGFFVGTLSILAICVIVCIINYLVKRFYK